MDPIEIEVRGPMKSGKSWAAVIIAEALERVGAKVNLVEEDMSLTQSNQRREKLRSGMRLPEMNATITTRQVKRGPSPNK